MKKWLGLLVIGLLAGAGLSGVEVRPAEAETAPRLLAENAQPQIAQRAAGAKAKPDALAAGKGKGVPAQQQALPSPKTAAKEAVLSAVKEAALPEKGEDYRDPRNGVSFTLPPGFISQGTYAKKNGKGDLMMRALDGDRIFVYTANGAMLSQAGKKETQPFHTRDSMLKLSLKTYLQEAAEKKLPVLAAKLGTFGTQPGFHIRQEEEGKLADRYFFADRKNLYTLSFLTTAEENQALQPAIAQMLDTLKIPTPYERVTIPGSSLSYEIPYGGVDELQLKEPGDPHIQMQMHVDDKLLTGVIYHPLQEDLTYAVLPERYENLGEVDRKNLCRVLTQGRQDQWESLHPGVPLEENTTYFSQAAGRTCLVEKTRGGGETSLGYLFLLDGKLLSLDYVALENTDNQAIIDHSVNSLRLEGESGRLQ